MKGRKKGTPKTGGRKPGSENKVQAELRLRIKMFLDNQFDLIQEDFMNLDPEKRILLYEKYLNYVVSKKTDVTSDGERLIPNLPDIVIKTKNTKD